MRQISCDVFAPSVDVLINSLTVARDAQFVIALRKSVPERVADKVVNGRLCLLLIGPVVKLRDPGLDLLQELNRYLFDFLDVLFREVFREQHIVEG